VNGTVNTFTLVDTINGGAGTDKLNLILDANGSSAALASVTNVEQFYIRDIGAGAQSDFGTLTGETQVWNDRSTSASDFINLGTGTVVGLQGNGSTILGATDLTMATAADAVTIAVAGGTVGNGVVTINSAPTAVTVSSSGAANTIGAVALGGAATGLTINAATNLTTGNVTGFTGTAATITAAGAAASLNLGTVENTTVATINASGLTAGGLTATLNSNAALAVTGGVGADVLTTGAVLTTGSVNAGDGIDTLTVADSTHLATAVLGAKYTNFETLGVTDGVSVDLDNIAGITAVQMTDGASTATALNDLSAVQAGAVTILAGDGVATIGVKGAATVGQIDTVKMTFNDGNTTLNQDINANAASTFTLAAVENLEVTAVDQVDIVQNNTASNDLTSVKLSGAGNISFVTGNMDQVNFSLDASASTGTNALDASTFATNGVAISGGTGVDTITGSGQADSINGGAGADVITGGVGADSLTGDAGNDTFFFADAAADTGITVATADVIQDFNTGSDQIDIDTAAAGVAWVNNTTVGGVNIATTVAANFAGALTAANGVLTGTVDQYAFQHDGTNGYLFIDDDGAAGADSVIVLAGIDNTEFAFGDVIA
jgi:hypothetical protein